MLEREIKCQVPKSAEAALLRALKDPDARTQPLHARYFDTPTRELARRRLALRLRLEGHTWVQTLKAPGPDAFSRLEFNHVRPEPTLDLRLYDDTPVADTLDALAGQLYPLYETRVERLSLRRTVGDSEIELAFDRGTIASGLVEIPVRELEFELVEGEASDLFTLVRDWMARHALILDLRSKSERGTLVAAAALQVGEQPRLAPDALARALLPARRARTITLPAGLSPAAAARHALDDPLQQVIRNAALLAGAECAPPTAADTIEHIHQLRVGIRRLRSLWRFFSGWHVPDPALADTLRTAFQALGQSRDEDVVRTEVLPQLMAAGLPEAPAVGDDNDATPDTSALARSPAFQCLLLDLLQDQSTSAGLEDPVPADALDTALAQRLNRQLKRIRKAGQHFTELPVEARHDLRKRVKQLRYAVDACQSRLNPVRTRKLVAALGAVQSCLGDYNDLTVAESWFAARTPQQPATAWFAQGWLRAMQAQNVTRAAGLLQQLDQAGRFKPL